MEEFKAAVAAIDISGTNAKNQITDAYASYVKCVRVVNNTRDEPSKNTDSSNTNNGRNINNETKGVTANNDSNISLQQKLLDKLASMSERAGLAAIATRAEINNLFGYVSNLSTKGTACLEDLELTEAESKNFNDYFAAWQTSISAQYNDKINAVTTIAQLRELLKEIKKNGLGLWSRIMIAACKIDAANKSFERLELISTKITERNPEFGSQNNSKLTEIEAKILFAKGFLVRTVEPNQSNESAADFLGRSEQSIAEAYILIRNYTATLREGTNSRVCMSRQAACFIR